MQAMTEDKIQARAYELWELEGRPHGRAEEFWFRATTELSTNGSNGSVKKAKKSAAPKAAASAKTKAVAAPAAKPPVRVAAHGVADHQGSLEAITLGARESAEFVPPRAGRYAGQDRAGLAVLTARALYNAKRRAG